MPGARAARVDPAAGDRELLQKRRDAGDRVGFTACHEAGAMSRAVDAAARPEIDEVHAALREPLPRRLESPQYEFPPSTRTSPSDAAAASPSSTSSTARPAGT